MTPEQARKNVESMTAERRQKDEPMTHTQALAHVRAITERTRQRSLALGDRLQELDWPAGQREIMDYIRTNLVLAIQQTGGSLRATETAVGVTLWLVQQLFEHGVIPAPVPRGSEVL